MARSHARIHFEIWDNTDFKALPKDARWMYVVILGDSALNQAGVVVLRPGVWADDGGFTDDEADGALTALAAARFVVIDDTTSELLVRTFIRGDKVMDQPNVLRNACALAPQTRSLAIRRTLIEELRKLPPAPPPVTSEKTGKVFHHPDPHACADAMERAAGGPENPSPNPSANPSPNPSEITPSRTLPGRVQGTPWGRGRGRGRGSSSVGGSVSGEQPRNDAGDRRARELAGTAHTPQAHRLLKDYAATCAQRPPTDVLAQLGPRIDGLLTDGYTADQIQTALTEWQHRGLAPSVLPSVAHQVVNGSRRSPLRVAANDGQLTDDEVDDILGPETGPLAPREIENGDPADRREWYIRETRKWRADRRETAQARLARRTAQ
jgi:hypothetical protein